MNWLKSLKVGDKLDIIDDKTNKDSTWWGIWHVGIIRDIKQENLCIHFDGWPQRYDERININAATTNKLQALHTNTPYHDSNLPSCQWRPSSKSYPCTICKKICCGKCFIVAVYRSNKLEYECKECLPISEYQYLFSLIKLIYESIFRQNIIEINILTLITNYSFDDIYSIKCNNKIKDCSNKIKYKKMEKKFFNHYIEYNSNCLITNKRLIICKPCQLLKERQSEKCVVFHDDHQNCNICQKALACTKCYNIKSCDGIGCDRYHCDECWELLVIASNSCSCHGNSILCSDCYNGSSICNKCSTQICVTCYAICTASGCTENLCKSCQCIACNGNTCNNCCGELRKCYECEDDICNRSNGDECIRCHNELCAKCKTYISDKCASTDCNNNICAKCRDIKDVTWCICNGCQYFYTKQLNICNMKVLFCDQCVAGFNKCTECSNVYCKSCFTKEQFQCIGCKSKTEK